MHILIWVVLGGVVLWAVLYLLSRIYDFESRNISLSPGFLMWRTEHGLGVIDRISKRWPRFWNYFGKASGVVGVIMMFVMTIALTSNVVYFLFAEVPEGVGGGAYIALPGVTIPFIGGVVAIATLLMVHEPAHGVVMRNLGLKTKATGFILLFIIPGAFVEEDEEEFENAPVSDRIKIAGAGSFSNFILGGIVLVIIISLVNPLSGLYITGVAENTPASKAGLEPGMQIKSINNFEIPDGQTFSDYMDNTSPGQMISLETQDRNFDITLKDHQDENTGHLGVYARESLDETVFLNPLYLQFAIMTEVQGNPLINQYTYSSSIPWFIISLLKWISFLNIAVALFNLLPLQILDGGHIARGIAERFSSPSTADIIVKVLTGGLLIVLLLNFFPQMV